MHIVFFLPLIVYWLSMILGGIYNNKVLLNIGPAIGFAFAGIWGVVLLLNKYSSIVDKRILLFISPGLISFGIGDAVWAYYELILKIEPEEPFASTFFYYIFYITSILALISINHFIYKKFHDKEDNIVLTIAYTFFPIISIALVFFAFSKTTLDEYGTIISFIVNFGYIIFDVIILSLLVYPAYKFRGGEISKFYMFYATGMFFITIADLVYWIIGSSYQVGSIPDYIWLIGTSFIYIALYQRWKDVF
ncbi:MAG: hypothetical protein N2504_01265 [candidate division WOR-3 bacterium]|nr:hypothetical protein [candidate division WOR-3 bacterium]